MATVAEALVETFLEAGTSFFTGIPGEETLEMIDAAHKRGLRFILSKDESAAAFMSATWGDLTGVPGVCVTTRGPGAANIVLGVTQAWMDRSPLIALTDQFAPPVYETGLRQRLDQVALFAPITKWNGTIHAKSVRRQLRRGIRAATAHPPGPVQFDIPASERNLEAEPISDALLYPNLLSLPTDRAATKAQLQLLSNSRRPLILAGLGVLWSKACDEMVQMAEQLGAPVLTTPKCKGAIPEDHPLSAGCLFGGRLESRLISDADLLITVGLDPVELQPVAWPYKTPVLALSSADGLDATIPAVAEIIGDLKSILRSIAESMGEGTSWGEQAARTFRKDVNDALSGLGSGLTAPRIMELSRSVLPRDTIMTCDVGGGRLFSVPKFPVYAPRQYLTSNGAASMGYSLPAAMGAKIARPKQPVVAFTGDGSLMVAVSELHTAVRENLPVTVVVLDNAELGVMRLKQDISGMSRYGTALGGIDWEKLAQAFGADGLIVENENALGDALSRAANSSRTTVIGVKVDSSGYVDQYNALRGRN